MLLKVALNMINQTNLTYIAPYCNVYKNCIFHSDVTHVQIY